MATTEGKQAEGRPLQEPQRGGKPTGRVLTPQGGRADPDTAHPFQEPDEIPEANQNNPNMNTAVPLPVDRTTIPEAQQIVHPNILDVAPRETAPLQEPVRATENWVVIRANTNHSCFIGDRQWHFEKDKAVRVPRTVAEILARGGKIYPIF